MGPLDELIAHLEPEIEDPGEGIVPSAGIQRRWLVHGATSSPPTLEM